MFNAATWNWTKLVAGCTLIVLPLVVTATVPMTGVAALLLSVASNTGGLVLALHAGRRLMGIVD